MNETKKAGASAPASQHGTRATAALKLAQTAVDAAFLNLAFTICRKGGSK